MLGTGACLLPSHTSIKGHRDAVLMKMVTVFGITHPGPRQPPETPHAPSPPLCKVPPNSWVPQSRFPTSYRCQGTAWLCR